MVYFSCFTFYVLRFMFLCFLILVLICCWVCVWFCFGFGFGFCISKHLFVCVCLCVFVHRYMCLFTCVCFVCVCKTRTKLPNGSFCEIVASHNSQGQGTPKPGTSHFTVIFRTSPVLICVLVCVCVCVLLEKSCWWQWFPTPSSLKFGTFYFSYSFGIRSGAPDPKLGVKVKDYFLGSSPACTKGPSAYPGLGRPFSTDSW